MLGSNARQQQQVSQRQEEERVKEDEQMVEAKLIVRQSMRVFGSPN